MHLWADGLYLKVRLEGSKAALLLLIGALANGRKVVLALESGVREMTESWANMLRDLKPRAAEAPKLTIADGNLGIWSALAAIYPTSAEQRCWNHKLRNVLDAIPRTRQDEVKPPLQAIANAETQATCERRVAAFRRTYGRVFPKAVRRLGTIGSA